jgi:hypothetical protein
MYACQVEESSPPLWSSFFFFFFFFFVNPLLFASCTNLWSSGQSSWLQIGDVLFSVRYELNLYMLCR